jgi:hypothetical protein
MYERTRIVTSRSTRKGRGMLRLGAAGALAAVLALPLQAHAVELGGLTVPTVTVKPPPLPVPTVPKLTPPPVPTVTVKAPPLPPPPKLPVKAPTPTTPTVTVPTVKVPTVKAPAPPAPVNGAPLPAVSVPTVSVRTSPPPAVKVPAGAPSSAGAPANAGAATAPAGSRAPAPPGAAALSAGSGYNTAALTLPVFAQGLAARHRTRALAAMIRRYRACLADLPASMQTLLDLRAGLTTGRVLGPAATAARLHVSRAGYARLEKQAVDRLRTTVQQGCGASATSPGAGTGGYAPWSGTGRRAASGGVLDARYAKLAAGSGRRGGGASSSLFGLSLSPAARDSLLAAFLAFGGGALVFAFLFLDGLGIGPRHPRWRRQFRRRLSLRGPHGHLPRGALRRRF